MSIDLADPTALLLGEGITVLGAMRALRQAEVVSLVLSGRNGMISRSRWHRAAPPLGDGGLADYLKRMPSGSVLIPCSDDWLRRVAGLADSALALQFPSSLPPAGALERILDKGLFAELLRNAGIPHPETVLSGEASPHDERKFSAFFLKPRDSQAFMRRFGQKAIWPESPEHLARVLDEVASEGISVVIQEYIPGPASHHVFVDGFVDGAGDVKGAFARRRLRMYPSRFGNSSCMVSVHPSEVQGAVDQITTLLQSIGYRGVFSAEFKWDARDGLFKLLEVNARPWWFVEFAASCGVNVVEMAYLDALGLPVPEVLDYDVGRRLCHPYYDWYACRVEFPGFANATFQWLRSMVGSDKPVFEWRDPGPGISEALRLTTGFVSRRLPWGRRGDAGLH